MRRIAVIQDLAVHRGDERRLAMRILQRSRAA